MARHSTPDDVDFIFDRDYIDESEYVDFWISYWDRDKRGREALVNSYIDRAAQREFDFEKQGRFSMTVVGVVSSSRRTAEKQAKAMGEGARVIRRDRFGRFNKRGRSYQAIRYGKNPKH